MRAKKIICSQCGAALPPGTAVCPYCGSAYAPEAEREYMRKLDEIREDLDDVGDAGLHASRKEIGRNSRKIALIVGGILAFAALLFLLFHVLESRENMDNRKEYAWRQEHLAELDRLFEEGEYDALVEAFESARDEGHDLYDWDHYEFCTFWEEVTYVDRKLAERENGLFSKYDAEEVLYTELRIRGFSKRRRVPEEDLQIMAGLAQKYQDDLTDIFHATPEDLETFDQMLEKDKGYVSFEICSQYVKDHPEILLESGEN